MFLEESEFDQTMSRIFIEPNMDKKYTKNYSEAKDVKETSFEETVISKNTTSFIGDLSTMNHSMVVNSKLFKNSNSSKKKNKLVGFFKNIFKKKKRDEKTSIASLEEELSSYPNKTKNVDFSKSEIFSNQYNYI